MNGLVLVNKAGGCTSHDVVNRMRKIAGTKRIGHLGTLDPMATGLLTLMVGVATRLAPYLGGERKTYRATVRFGQISDTYDREGEIQQTSSVIPSINFILESLGAFRGRFWQKPPAISAKKIAGVPAYKLARKKLPVELRPVEVEIDRLDVLRLEGDELEVEVSCSAGTYIRSLAHDLGRGWDAGALLAALHRTKVGSFDVENARTLEELTVLSQEHRLAEAIIPPGRLLAHLPMEWANETQTLQIRQGRQFRVSPFTVPPGSPLVRVLSRSGDLIAIGKLVVPNLYQPNTVFGV